uniref:Tc1-like transposase DDE domain-containing protein n=1 Tax=Pseudonaja textilis TaxID=8673 RepID=A0A670ZPY9_PSETE
NILYKIIHSLHVLGRGSLTVIRYGDEILRSLVKPYAGTVGPGFLLMHNNARPHVAGVCQQFLQDEGIDTMDWPIHSSDLNPIDVHCNVLPANEYFSFNQNSTRAHNRYKLKVNRTKLDCKKYNFSNRVVNVWNTLPWFLPQTPKTLTIDCLLLTSPPS